MSTDEKDEVAAPAPDLTKRFHITSNGTVLATSDDAEDAKQQLADYKAKRGEALAAVQHFIAHPNPIVIDRGTKHQPKPGLVKTPGSPVPGPAFHPPPHHSRAPVTPPAAAPVAPAAPAATVVSATPPAPPVTPSPASSGSTPPAKP